MDAKCQKKLLQNSPNVATLDCNTMSYDPENERTPTIVERCEWGAENPKAGYDLLTEIPAPWVFTTFAHQVPRCPVIKRCPLAVKALQKYHMDWGAIDLPYNFLFCGNKVFEGRGWGYTSPHPPFFPEAEGKCYTFAFVGAMIIDYEDRLRFFKLAYQLVNYAYDNDYLERDTMNYRMIPEDWNVYKKFDKYYDVLEYDY